MKCKVFHLLQNIIKYVGNIGLSKEFSSALCLIWMRVNLRIENNGITFKEDIYG